MELLEEYCISKGKELGAKIASYILKKICDYSVEKMSKIKYKKLNLKIRKNPEIKVKDKKVMFNIIKSAYMQRRKTLLNSLSSVGVFKTKNQGIEFLKKLGLREDIRPENMKIEDFAKLTNLFINNLGERKE